VSWMSAAEVTPDWSRHEVYLGDSEMRITIGWSVKDGAHENITVTLRSLEVSTTEPRQAQRSLVADPLYLERMSVVLKLAADTVHRLQGKAS
jgi:hypothetical protein